MYRNIEYKVQNVREFTNFLNKEIGTEYYVEKSSHDEIAYVMVFDITAQEEAKINNYLK